MGNTNPTPPVPLPPPSPSPEVHPNPYDTVYVFHDSENCYISSRLEERNSDGRLRRTVDGKILFGNTIRTQGAVIYKEVLRWGIACKIGREAAEKVDVVAGDNTYYYVRNSNDISSPFSTPRPTLGDFECMGGFHNMLASGKPDGVDVKIKELFSNALGKMNSLTVEARQRVLFIIVSGDKDYHVETLNARRLQIDIAVIHSADQPISSSFKHQLARGFSPCCWLDIVEMARNDNQPVRPLPPPPHPPTPPPPIAPTLAIPVNGDILCRNLNIPYLVALYVKNITRNKMFEDAVRAVHPAFAVRITLKPFNCELVYSTTTVTSMASPTDIEIAAAVDAVNNEAKSVVVTEPREIQGVSSEQLINDKYLQSFCYQRRILNYVQPSKNPVMLNSAPSPPQPDAVTPLLSPLNMVEAAEALRAFVYDRVPGRKMAPVDLYRFYDVCSPAVKSIIHNMKLRVFCEANSQILRFYDGFIHAESAPLEPPWLLFKFILQQGSIDSVDKRMYITGKKMGDFYGPKGKFPHLKAVITESGQKLKGFLQKYPKFFDCKDAEEEDGFLRIFAKCIVPEQSGGNLGSSPHSSPVKGPPPHSSSMPAIGEATVCSRVTLVHIADNVTVEMVWVEIESKCPPVSDSIVLQDDATVNLCVAALPKLRSLALYHSVTNLEVKQKSLVLTGARNFVINAKESLQKSVESIRRHQIDVSRSGVFQNTPGLFQGLKIVAHQLINAATIDNNDQDNESVSSDINTDSRNMSAHIIRNPKRHQALLLFLPPSRDITTVDDQNEAIEIFDAICTAVQRVVDTYSQFLCSRSSILPTVDKNNLKQRFSLYDVRVDNQGILLCGPQASVQEASNYLTIIPEGDQFERRAYKASDRSVAFLLDLKCNGAVLQALKQAVTAVSGATVAPYTGVKSASNTIVFIVEGKMAAVNEAFKRANLVEANWVTSFVTKPLCDGNLSPGRLKYLAEENSALLPKLCSQFGVFLRQTKNSDISPATKNIAVGGDTKPVCLLKAYIEEVELRIYSGDILRVGCDAIVNPANENLNHSAGLAAAIADAAGRADIEREGSAIKALLPGQIVRVGTSVSTEPYELRKLNKYIKLVIHAVGPVCSAGGSARERDEYRRCVLSALDLAETAHVEYIAFTLMGAGLYNWPSELAAELLFECISEWIATATARGTVKLKRISLVDILPSCTAAMVSASQTFNERIPSLLAKVQLLPSLPISHPPRPQHKWFWETWEGDGPVFNTAEKKEGDRRWVPYDYDQVLQIEHAIALNTMPVTLVGDINRAGNGAQYQISNESFYTFDKKEAVQYSQMRVTPGIKVNFKRAVRCEPFLTGMSMAGYYEPSVSPPPVLPIVSVVHSSVKRLSEVSRISLMPVNKNAAVCGGLYSLMGTPVQVTKVEESLLQMLQQLRKTSATPLDMSDIFREDWETVLKNMRAAIRDEGLEVEILPLEAPDTADPAAGTRRGVLVNALGSNELSKGELAVSNFVNRYLRILWEEALTQWPNTWTGGPFSVKDPVQLVDVPPDSAEWEAVKEEWLNRAQTPTSSDATADAVVIHRTTGFTLIKVQRVQNPVAWAKYYDHVKRIADLVNPVGSGKATSSLFTRANEWTMKHGTYQKDPNEVVMSEAVLDFRYASEGRLFFGRGTYTAEDADYAHNYAFRVPDNADNARQMLLVRVVAGKIHNISVDGCTNGEHNKLKHPPPGFHSVRGNVGLQGAQRRMAIVVYETNYAYPSYIITYKSV